MLISDVYLYIGQCFVNDQNYTRQKKRTVSYNKVNKVERKLMEAIQGLQKQLSDLDSYTKRETDQTEKLDKVIMENMKNYERKAMEKLDNVVNLAKQDFVWKQKEIDMKIEITKAESQAKIQEIEKEALKHLQEVSKTVETRLLDKEKESLVKMEHTAMVVDNNVRILVHNVQSTVMALLEDLKTKLANFSGNTKTNLESKDDVRYELNRKQEILTQNRKMMKEYLKHVHKTAHDLEMKLNEQVLGLEYVDKFSDSVVETDRQDIDLDKEHKMVKSVDEDKIGSNEKEVKEEERKALAEWRDKGWEFEKQKGQDEIQKAVECEREGECVFPEWLNPELADIYNPDSYKDKDYGKI